MLYINLCQHSMPSLKEGYSGTVPFCPSLLFFVILFYKKQPDEDIVTIRLLFSVCPYLKIQDIPDTFDSIAN